jgi:putative ABC transport system permease protein
VIPPPVWVEFFYQDVRFAIRALVKAPLFTAIAVATLALGIGANTATFSVLRSISLNPLPYRDPDRLVTIAESDGRTPNPEGIAVPTVYDWRTRSHSFETLCIWGDFGGLRMLSNGEVDLIRGLAVNYDFFDALGIKMYLGRSFAAEDDRPKTADKLILSYGLWARKFGGDPGVIGRRVTTLADRSYTVIGVLPADFHPIHMSNVGEIPQGYVPLGWDLNEDHCRSCRGRRVIGRLKPGITPGQARAELNSIMHDLAREYPADYARDASVVLVPLRKSLMGRFDAALMVLFGAVGLLLLLACSNVANLLLVRATVRRAEMALRASLGAGRGRLVRQMLTESLVLALLGGVAGVGCAYWVTRLISHLGASEIPRVDEIRPDISMLLWGLSVSGVTGLLFGVLPALQASRLDLRSVLQGATNSSKGRANLGFLTALITVEIALAFVLVLGVGLLGKSYLRLLGVNPGYDPRNVLTLSLLPDWLHHDTAEKVLGCYDAVVAHMMTIPSVEAAGYASTLPLSHPQTNRFYVREQALAANSDAAHIDTYFVSPGYLRAMKISLLRGRLIEERDRRGLAPVALVSESCARLRFNGQDPIGQHVQLFARDDKQPWATVVGVVGDVHQYGLDKAPDAAAYFVFAQAADPQGYARLVVRSSVSAERIEPGVRAAMHAVDPTLPIFHLQPMDAYIAKSLAQRTFALALIVVFGVLALVLATVGIYGVVSYTVGLRTREVGIRMALGAKPGDVNLLILRQVFITAVTGLVLGLAISLWFGRMVASLLFEVKPTDSMTICAVAALIWGVALAAAYIPARRAAQLAPLTALRVE